MGVLVILFLVGIMFIVGVFFTTTEENLDYERFIKSPKCPPIIFGKYCEHEFFNKECYPNVKQQQESKINDLKYILRTNTSRKNFYLYEDEIEQGYAEQILFFDSINQLDNCPALQKIRERDEHAKAKYEKWLKEKNVITDKQEVANND